MADKIYTPTADDAQMFSRLHGGRGTAAAKRINSSRVKMCKWRKTAKLQVSGQVAVMEINGLLAKIIFDKNTNQRILR